jgi:hypothetical protein
MYCPIAKQDCRKTDCAWFHDGECAVASLPDLVEKLEDVTDALKEVKREIGGIVSAM